MENKVINLNRRPNGEPVAEDFKIETIGMPKAGAGEILLKTVFVSVDPYLRGRMNDTKSYVPPFQLNEPVQSGIIAEVVESNNDHYPKGSFVSGILDWKKYQLSDGNGLNITDPKAAPLSSYLGILGMTGLTAYFGLMHIGKPKAGETVVVSGAAGAVGIVVGQIAKIQGCRVVGIAGTDEKIDMLKNEFGFDEGINYKTTKDMNKAIAAACPDGVDVYFDNVGGEISDAVIKNINFHARIPLCGQISLYNSTEVPMGPRLQPMLLTRSVLMQGFIVSNFQQDFPEGIKMLGQWVKEGKLKFTETIEEGFENLPTALLGLFKGENTGKMVVKA